MEGETSEQIFKDFQKKSPIKAEGQYDAKLGVADIKITPEAEYEIRGKRCHVENVRVIVDVVIHLPRWVNYPQADNENQQRWDKLFNNVKVHEAVFAV